MPTLRTTPTRDSVGRFRCPARQVSTVDIEACQVRQKLRLNARFNSVVTKLWPRLDATSKQDIARAQRSWNRFVHDECDVAYRAFLGGTIRGPIGGQCYVDLTRARVKEVSGMLALYSQGH
jgi:uncharacterized protein YecT (DUF1311 family)